MKRIITILAFIPTICLGQWTQLGNPINGLQQGDKLGQSVSLNNTGQVVSIGLPGAGSSDAGQVQVFEWNGTNWNMKGGAINGTNNGDLFGYKQHINDAGDVVVIGAPGFNVSPPFFSTGYAAIYEYNGNNWIQRGTNLLGDSLDDSFGTEISLNSDGSIVAVSAEPYLYTNYIRVFQWNGTAWNQLGSDISSGAVSNGFGRSIALNASGTTLAVGVVNHNNPSTNIGMLRVYEWNGIDWIQKGSDLSGDAQGDFFGTGVSINDSGTIIAAGARDNVFNMSRGYVKIYEWSGSAWIQKGSNLTGNAGDFFGDVNDMNGTGDMIISGTILGDYVKIHQFQSSNWAELDSIASSGGQFGTAVSLNNTGSRIAIGAYQKAIGGFSAVGQATVFENNAILSIDNIKDFNEVSIYPNPTTEFIQILSKQSIRCYKILSMSGRVIRIAEVLNQTEFKIDIGDLNTGTYLLLLESNGEKSCLKIIKE